MWSMFPVSRPRISTVALIAGDAITIDVAGVDHAPRARNDAGLTVPERVGAATLPVTANGDLDAFLIFR
jgi:hypothetical protein